MNALVLLIVTILFVVSLLILAWTHKRLQAIDSQIQTQKPTDYISAELTALNKGFIGLGERLLALEKSVQVLSGRTDDMSLQLQNHTPYAHAISLAQQGSSPEDIMELCQISRNEAELLLTIHKNDKAA